MGENYFIERAVMCTNEKERRVELQRAADVASNKIRWEAARAAVEKAPAEIVTTEERTDVAEQPSNIASISPIFQVPNSLERLLEITQSEVEQNKKPIMAADIMRNDAADQPFSSSSASQISESPTSNETF